MIFMYVCIHIHEIWKKTKIKFLYIYNINSIFSALQSHGIPTTIKSLHFQITSQITACCSLELFDSQTHRVLCVFFMTETDSSKSRGRGCAFFDETTRNKWGFTKNIDLVV